MYNGCDFLCQLLSIQSLHGLTGFREDFCMFFLKIVSLSEISVAMQFDSVLIQPGQKPNATFPPPQ